MAHKPSMAEMNLIAAQTRAGEPRRWMVFTFTLAGLLLLSLAANMLLAFKWQPEVRWAAITQDPTMGMQVSVLPERMPEKMQHALIRKHLRDYIIKRHTIDHVTEHVRFPWVVRSSDVIVAEAFEEDYEVHKDDYRSVFREVEIIEDRSLPTFNQHTYVHHFVIKTYDYEGTAFKRTPENTQAINLWTVTLQYVVNSHYVTPDIALENPMGVFVIGYRLEERKKEA